MDQASAPARTKSQRKADTVERLRTDIDLWVASASEDARAYLVPLSYHWDGSTLMVATPSASPTARNLLRAGWVRVALGHTRDVVIVQGTVEAIPISADPVARGTRTRGRPGSTRGHWRTSTSTSASPRGRSRRGANRTSSSAACSERRVARRAVNPVDHPGQEVRSSPTARPRCPRCP